jgi:hypothetical protein
MYQPGLSMISGDITALIYTRKIENLLCVWDIRHIGSIGLLPENGQMDQAVFIQYLK